MGLFRSRFVAGIATFLLPGLVFGLAFSALSCGDKKIAGKVLQNLNDDEGDDDTDGIPPGGYPIPPAEAPDSGEEFFYQNVVAAFRTKNCQSCHNGAIFAGGATSAIFNYASMRAFLSIGPSATNNGLINRLLGTAAHTSPVQCANAGVAPCKAVQDWWNAEPAGTLGQTAGPVGGIGSVSAAGAISGYAFDPDAPNQFFNVEVWLDGPAGTGTLLATLTANQARATPPLNNGFSYSNATLQTGQLHRLFFYVIKPSTLAKVELARSPALHMVGFIPANKAYFDNTVAPALSNRCSRCHGAQFADYLTVRNGYMLSPSPFVNGSATNNAIINPPSGNGPHFGGNVCGGVNGSPCLEMQRMYEREYP